MLCFIINLWRNNHAAHDGRKQFLGIEHTKTWSLNSHWAIVINTLQSIYMYINIYILFITVIQKYLQLTSISIYSTYLISWNASDRSIFVVFYLGYLFSHASSHHIFLVQLCAQVFPIYSIHRWTTIEFERPSFLCYDLLNVYANHRLREFGFIVVKSTGVGYAADYDSKWVYVFRSEVNHIKDEASFMRKTF